MSFEKAMGKMKYDVRLLEYNLSQGFITKAEYEKHLSQLEDSAHLVDIEDEVGDEANDTPETENIESH